MRSNVPVLRRISEALRKRDWFGIGFELFVVVVGVVLGLQASRWAEDRERREYRRQILVSLDRTLADYEYEGGRIHNAITGSLNDYARRTAAGERPPPPTLVMPTLERPPTRAWEAMVQTGVARSIEPGLMFRLALLFDFADSWGQKYARYTQFTEQQVAPFRAAPAHFYGADGKLKTAYSSHIQMLRDLLELSDLMREEAAANRRILRQRDPDDASVPVKDLPIEI
jgi:hypothetical protein